MDSFAVVIPILCFAALLRKERFRESFIIAAIATALFVVFATETLSLFKALSFLPVTFFWLTYLTGLVAWRYRIRTASAPFVLPVTTAAEKVILALMALIAVATGITAVVAAPNNFDSLTYHLPRVMHWIQNHSVSHYPTNNDRQLVLAPFSEFCIMHLQLLAGSDRFANCVQWFAMLGSTVGVSLITRELKGSRTAQLAAAALALSLPMGILQSTSTQNDYTVAFWIVCLVWLIVRTKEEKGLRHAATLGAVLALAILTKGTAYMIAAPFMTVYLWLLLRQGMKTAALSLAVVAAAILLVNAGHFARNVAVYGSPLSPGTGNDIIAKRFTPASVASGITKNVVSQLGGEPAAVNRGLYLFNHAVHRLIGTDPSDPALSSDDFIVLPAQVKYHEDYAPNPLHMAILIVSAVVMAVRWRRVPAEAVLLFVAGIGSFVILSACLKWTLYLSRYFIAFFVVSAPVIALLYDRLEKRAALQAAAVLLLLLSLPAVAENQMRPLFGPKSVLSASRFDQYFMARPESEPYFISLANMTKSQPNSNVGLMNNGGNNLEYLVWVVLNDGKSTYRIEHLDVTNPSGRLKLAGFSSWYPVGF